MPNRNFDDPNDDEDVIEPGEYQGQTVRLRPDGAEWREQMGCDGRPLGIGLGTYVWEYECPVCRTFYYAGPEPHKHVCSFCEITHDNLGAKECRTPRHVAPVAVPRTTDELENRRRRVMRSGAPLRRSTNIPAASR